MNSIKSPLKVNLTTAYLVLFIYIVILLSLQLTSGVTYDKITESTKNFRSFVLYPVAVASLFLTIIAIIGGWWKLIWEDKFKIKVHSWLHLFSALMILTIFANFASGNIAEGKVEFLITGLIACILVGYSEEVMFRGFILQGARASGNSELKVLLIVMVTFGLFHFVNIFTGSPIFAVIFQVLNAGLLGGALYVIFRKTGTLWIPILIHAFADFSLLSKVSEAEGLRKYLAAMAFLQPLILIVLLGLSTKIIKATNRVNSQP